MPGVSLATWEVSDPHDLTVSLWERFAPGPGSALSPEQFCARTYAAADWRRYQVDPGAYRTLMSVGQVGNLCVVCANDAAATHFSIKSPGLDLYCLTFIQRGAGELRPSGGGTPAPFDAEHGLMFAGLPKTAISTSDGSAKLNVWLPVGLVRRQAALLLDEAEVGDIDFDATVDCRTGAGASLRRLTEFLFTELAQADSLLANRLVAVPAEELLVQSILTGLSHSRSAQLRGQAFSAAPRNIRRAEEFIRAHADEAITVERIARAAGCSIRALQIGFRRFRNMTPMSAVRRARLARARNEILHSDGSCSVIDVAMRHGFGNAGRFSDIYRQTFGEYPSETLRARAASALSCLAPPTSIAQRRSPAPRERQPPSLTLSVGARGHATTRSAG